MLLAERSRIRRSDPLAHQPRRLVAACHVGMKACRRSRRRRGADDDRREREEIVRLHDHRKAPAVLDTAPAARQRDRVELEEALVCALTSFLRRIRRGSDAGLLFHRDAF